MLHLRPRRKVALPAGAKTGTFEIGLLLFVFPGFISHVLVGSLKMKEPTPILEYGQPIDVQTMVDPTDPAELELEAGHPGLGDTAYVERRRALFALCRSNRLNRQGPPLIDYTPEETRIW